MKFRNILVLLLTASLVISGLRGLTVPDHVYANTGGAPLVVGDADTFDELFKDIIQQYCYP
jgi:hypothetical protein